MPRRGTRITLPSYTREYEARFGEPIRVPSFQYVEPERKICRFNEGDLIIANDDNNYGITNHRAGVMIVKKVYKDIGFDGMDILVSIIDNDAFDPESKYPVQSKYFKIHKKKYIKE